MAAKYCRYCQHLEAGRCRKTGNAVSPEHARHTTTCRDFCLNPVDALRMNRKGYTPRERVEKPVTDGHQITMLEVLHGHE